LARTVAKAARMKAPAAAGSVSRAKRSAIFAAAFRVSLLFSRVSAYSAA